MTNELLWATNTIYTNINDLVCTNVIEFGTITWTNTISPALFPWKELVMHYKVPLAIAGVFLILAGFVLGGAMGWAMRGRHH